MSAWDRFHIAVAFSHLYSRPQRGISAPGPCNRFLSGYCTPGTNLRFNGVFIADRRLESFSPPLGKNWCTVYRRNGSFRAWFDTITSPPHRKSVIVPAKKTGTTASKQPSFYSNTSKNLWRSCRGLRNGAKLVRSVKRLLTSLLVYSCIAI